MSEKAKRGAKKVFQEKQKIVIKLAIIAAIVCVMYALSMVWLASIFPNTVGTYEGDEAKSVIANYIDPLPESASVIYLWHDAWIDVRGQIRFSLPPTDARLWFDSNSWSCEDLPYPTQVSLPQSYSDVEWWAHDNIQVGVASRCYSDNGWYQYYVIMDQTHDGVWTYFIEFRSTN